MNNEEREILNLRQQNLALARKNVSQELLINHLLEKLNMGRFDALYEMWCVHCVDEDKCLKTMNYCTKLKELLE